MLNVSSMFEGGCAARGCGTVDRGPHPSTASWEVEPLEADAHDDPLVLTSKRRLVRVAVAAADAGARFAREGLPEDAAAWMLAPRRMFGGRAPVEACQDLGGFERSIVLHGLRLGLDADPAELDELLADAGPDAAGGDCGGAVVHLPVAARPRRRLLTCWLRFQERGVRTYAFCAMVTDDPDGFVERIVGRYGSAAAAAAEFAYGFDPTSALANAMIGEALADTLALAAADPDSAPALGLDVVVEQRFAA